MTRRTSHMGLWVVVCTVILAGAVRTEGQAQCEGPCIGEWGPMLCFADPQGGQACDDNAPNAVGAEHMILLKTGDVLLFDTEMPAECGPIVRQDAQNGVDGELRNCVH